MNAQSVHRKRFSSGDNNARAQSAQRNQGGLAAKAQPYPRLPAGRAVCVELSNGYEKFPC
jgi:hypothetical protein